MTGLAHVPLPQNYQCTREVKKEKEMGRSFLSVYDITGLAQIPPTKGANSVSDPRTTTVRAILKVKPSKRGMDTANVCDCTGCPESLGPCFTIRAAVGLTMGNSAKPHIRCGSNLRWVTSATREVYIYKKNYKKLKLKFWKGRKRLAGAEVTSQKT